jgi:hypothetical protein
VFEILNFETIIKLNATIIDLNVWGILMFHCRRGKNMVYIHVTG